LPVPFHPRQGCVLICDFEGLRVPEMTKRRPVVVVSPKLRSRRRLCCVAPLSTTDPDPISKFHCYIEFDPLLPAPYDSRHMWVKADMIYTMSLDRMNMPFYKDESGRRQYVEHYLTEDQFKIVTGCVLEGLGLGHLKN